MPQLEKPAFVPQPPHRKVLADLAPNLRSNVLHSQAQSDFQKQLAAEKIADKIQRTFVAKPLPASLLEKGSRFLPKPSVKPLTTPSNVALSSDVRAEQRAAYTSEQASRQSLAEKAFDGQGGGHRIQSCLL